MDGIAHHRLAGDDHLVADLQMANHANVAAQQAIAADLCAAGDTGAAGDRTVRADAAVVRNLHQVVHAHVFFQHGVFQRAAVDAGVGPNFAIVADHHAAQLRHLDPVASVHRQAKAVGAEHRAGMHAHALAQANTGHQGNAGNQFASVIDHAVFADDAAGADHATIAHAAARANAHKRADMRSWRHGGGRVDHCGGMDAGRTHRRDIE